MKGKSLNTRKVYICIRSGCDLIVDVVRPSGKNCRSVRSKSIYSLRIYNEKEWRIIYQSNLLALYNELFMLNGFIARAQFIIG